LVATDASRTTLFGRYNDRLNPQRFLGSNLWGDISGGIYGFGNPVRSDSGFCFVYCGIKSLGFLGERYYVTFALSRLSVCLSLRNIVAAYSEG